MAKSNSLKTANDVTRLASNLLTVNKKLKDTKPKAKKAAKPAKEDTKAKKSAPAQPAAPAKLCISCGKDVTGLAFCSGCGTKVEERSVLKMICKGCGTTVDAGGMFCPMCGTKMD